MESTDISNMDRKTFIGYLSSSEVDSKSISTQNDCKNSENISSKVSKLDDVVHALNIEKSDLSQHFFKIKDCHVKYTLMQFAVINGLKEFVKQLLDNDVSPNFPQENTRIRRKRIIFSGVNVQREDILPLHIAKCSKNPLLLAAEFGQYEILRLFKYHTKSPEHKTRFESEMVEVKANDEQVPPANSGTISGQTVNFKVCDAETNENVLHYVLRQPLLGKDRVEDLKKRYDQIQPLGPEKKSLEPGSFFHSTDNKSATRKTQLEKMAQEYKKSLDVLLDMDKFENKNFGKRWISNDASYYPVQIEAIVNSKDKDDNTPLHYAVLNWSEEYVEMLLALGANASIRNKYNEIPLTRIRKSTLENFMDKECIIVKDFDQRDDKVEEDIEDDETYVKKNQAYNQSFMMRIGLCGKQEDNQMTFNYGFLAPPGMNRNEYTSSSGDIERQEYQNKGNLPEMELLWEMGKSKEHRSLIVHPVIDSYLWMKCQLIKNYFHRIVRLHFLFLYCVTWYLFLNFGGHNWNSVRIMKNGTHVFNESAGNSFCRDLGMDFNDFDLNDETQTGASTVLSGSYYAFLFVFMAKFFLMIRDFISEQFHSTVQNHVVSLWMDLFNIFWSVVILLFGRKILLVVLTALLIYYLGIEMLEIMATKRNYFKEISNYIDLVMIALIMAVLYVPNEYMWNPKIFSIFDKTEEQIKYE